MIDPKVHRLEVNAELPARFTFPFHYEPHALCRSAAGFVGAYLRSRTDWRVELDAGKMLGVLVVRCADGTVGFLAAFSGNLAGSNVHDYFVPPVYDLLQPDGEFRRGESEISAINRQIASLEHSTELTSLEDSVAGVEQQWQLSIDAHVALMRTSKASREALRRSGECTEAQLQKLAAESQYQKAELKRLKARAAEAIAEARAPLDAMRAQISALKSRRKSMSEALQHRIFDLFVVHNARGERQTLTQVFAATGHEPPAGAGECAAPKLLEYAYRHQLQPLCMAEFWWGRSPQAEVRLHGHYYPACHSKCGPILGFMLQGLDVDDNPLIAQPESADLKVVYDDEWLMVVDKPAGMLSVPGKDGLPSVQEKVREMLPDATGPLAVHRLDMATSGLLVVAKTAEVHKALQEQFASRKVSKTYVAVVEGEIAADEGYVRLPLRPDIDDRPRQLVDFEHGRAAATAWRVISRNATDGTVRLEMHPLTGRTHQLRVHAAHYQGLNAPMVGDRLYGGRRADRLMLHAASITFAHPITGHRITVQSPVPF